MRFARSAGYARLAVLFAVLFAAVACTLEKSPQQMADETLSLREQALNKRNLPMYMKAVSARYGGTATGAAQLEARAGKLFSTLDEIRYTSFERQFYQDDGGRIQVVQRFTMELTSEGNTKSLSGQEQLFLVEEGGRWLIVDGL